MIIFPTGPGYMMVHLRHDANICISALEVMMSLLIASRYKRIFYSSPEIEFSRSSSKITEVKKRFATLRSEIRNTVLLYSNFCVLKNNVIFS